MLWQQLSKAALLGLENCSLTPEALAELERLGVSIEDEPTLVVANGVAMLQQLRKAGFHLQNFEGELPNLPPTIEQDHQVSHRSSQQLELMLAGSHSAVLGEFFRLVGRAGKQLPATAVPGLMRQPGIDSVFGKIRPLLSPAAQWLMRQHPSWQRLLADPSQFDWHTGLPTERTALFRHLRQTVPSRALDLLKSTWDTERPEAKAGFVQLLDIGLSVADEPFLEACLDDRRKEVRHAAAALLPKVTTSRLSKRMAQRAVDFFELRRNSLTVNVLKELDASSERDGILKINPAWQGGAHAAYLGQVVSLVPPRHWELTFGKTPEEVLQLFMATDWRETLLTALVHATVLHQDGEWAALLAVQLPSEMLESTALGSKLEALFQLVPGPVAHRLAKQEILAASDLPGNGSKAMRLLDHGPEYWPDELTMLIINKFRNEIFRDYRQFWQLQHLKSWLQLLALHCQPSMYEQLQSGWGSSEAPQWRMWEKPVEDMLRTVLFRREMQQTMGF